MWQVFSPHADIINSLGITFGSNDQFNYYLDPQLSRARGLCSVDDVLGKWALVFRGTDYPNLNFEIVNKTVPGTDWDPVC